jgi:H+-translocating NAD(P) transhydrogenase subunit alpha
MTITVAVVRETAAGEQRVALVPDVAKRLRAKGVEIVMEKGAGRGAHIPDTAFADVETVDSATNAIGRGDVLFKVRPPSPEEIAAMREGSVLIGMLAPHQDDDRVRALRDRRITAFSMELLPRTTRAQAMDVLSSQAGMAGYKAVLIAAQTSGKFFPMLTTAAGTIRPSKVLIIGAGVAGLQAIATARRLGAQVEGFDVRPETREQIESLGAKFLDLGVSAAGEGGYARELTAEERAEQQRRLADHLKGIDVVITTAAVPGRPAPKIVSADMVRGMKAGSVLVDLAAETGGNCELTRPGETFSEGAVTIVGPINMPSMGAIHASEMYARNLFNFLELLIAEDGLKIDFEDDLVAGTCLTHDGEIRHAPTRDRVGSP